jgi:hypothetical protein
MGGRADGTKGTEGRKGCGGDGITIDVGGDMVVEVAFIVAVVMVMGASWNGSAVGGVRSFIVVVMVAAA